MESDVPELARIELLQNKLTAIIANTEIALLQPDAEARDRLRRVLGAAWEASRLLAGRAAVVRGESEPPPVESPHTVLIVEDDPASRLMLRLALEEEFGVRVVEAGDGAAALAAMDEHPDMVLLDMMLPIMDGAEVARRMRREATARELPILGLSGASTRATALAAGCNRFMAKPFNLTELLRVVGLHLPGSTTDQAATQGA
jgi:CheY-like chemotaxis protein